MTEKDNKPKRVGMTWQVNPDARVVLEKIKEETGVPQTETLTRVMEWFATLDRKLRLAVLNRDEETKAELLSLWVEHQLRGERKYRTAQTEFVKPPATGTPAADAPPGPPGPAPRVDPPRKGRR